MPGKKYDMLKSVIEETKKNLESHNLDEPEQSKKVPGIPSGYKTMLELSKEFKTDKQKIYRTIQKNEIPYQKINEIIYLDETAQTLIKSILFPDNTVSKNISEVHLKTNNDTVMKQLEKVIGMLQEELQNKNQQLNEKDKQIAELTKLVDQQQQLHLVEQRKVLQLEQKEAPEKKKGFFFRKS